MAKYTDSSIDLTALTIEDAISILDDIISEKLFTDESKVGVIPLRTDLKRLENLKSLLPRQFFEIFFIVLSQFRKQREEVEKNIDEFINNKLLTRPYTRKRTIEILEALESFPDTDKNIKKKITQLKAQLKGRQKDDILTQAERDMLIPIIKSIMIKNPDCAGELVHVFHPENPQNDLRHFQEAFQNMFESDINRRIREQIGHSSQANLQQHNDECEAKFKKIRNHQDETTCDIKSIKRQMNILSDDMDRCLKVCKDVKNETFGEGKQEENWKVKYEKLSELYRDLEETVVSSKLEDQKFKEKVSREMEIQNKKIQMMNGEIKALKSEHNALTQKMPNFEHSTTIKEVAKTVNKLLYKIYKQVHPNLEMPKKFYSLLDTENHIITRYEDEDSRTNAKQKWIKIREMTSWKLTTGNLLTSLSDRNEGSSLDEEQPVEYDLFKEQLEELELIGIVDNQDMEEVLAIFSYLHK